MRLRRTVRGPSRQGAAQGVSSPTGAVARAGPVVLHGAVCLGLDGIDVFVLIGLGFMGDRSHDLFVPFHCAMAVDADEPASEISQKQALFGAQVGIAGFVAIGIDVASNSVSNGADKVRSLFDGGPKMRAAVERHEKVRLFPGCRLLLSHQHLFIHRGI